jgi:hypothetical protein
LANLKREVENSLSIQSIIPEINIIAPTPMGSTMSLDKLHSRKISEK